MYTYSNVFEPEPYLYEFELSEQLEEKWKCGIEKGISMFLSDNQESIYSFSCELTKEDKIGSLSITLHLPNFPKTIEEMKIARYVFQQIFTCTFKQANFHNVIFNPQMIELLFDDNITKMPLQIHTRQAWLLIFADYYDKNLLLKCILHHILSNNFIPIFHSIRSDQAFEVLFKILTNGGNKFSKVSQSMEVYFKQDFREDFKEDFREYLREHSENLTKLYNHLIEHIVETEDISKMVKELGFYLEKEPTIISKKAKNIEIKVEVYGENDWFYIGGPEYLKSTKYRLSNERNPEIKFCVDVREKRKFYPCRGFHVEIKRIN